MLVLVGIVLSLELTTAYKCVGYGVVPTTLMSFQLTDQVGSGLGKWFSFMAFSHGLHC